MRPHASPARHPPGQPQRWRGRGSCVAAVLLALGLMPPTAALAQADAHSHDHWQWSAVLDVGSRTRPLALGTRDDGLHLGHSDLIAGGPLGRHLQARLSASAASARPGTERAVEEAWLETRTLPAGLSLRAGRMRSQIGALNPQHPHTDDFTDRPLLHRAFLGNHWYDDGVRLNLQLPTPVRWMVGAEILRGRQLVSSADALAPNARIATLVTKLSGELAEEHFWQAGLSRMANRRSPGLTDEAFHADATHATHGAEHLHTARFTGRQMWLLDATWAWSPDGDAEEPTWRTTLEAARLSGLGPLATPNATHRALAVATVWRMAAHWEVGARLSTLRVAMPSDDGAGTARLNEPAVMLAWKPSHQHTVRLQWSRQSANTNAAGFLSPAHRALTLQYLLAFGAHDGHSH